MTGIIESYFSSSTGAGDGSEGADAAKAPNLAAIAAAALTLASTSLDMDPGGGGGGTEGGANGLYARGGGDGGDTGGVAGAVCGGLLDIARRRRYASSPVSGGGRTAAEFLADSPGMGSLSSGTGAVGGGGADASDLRSAVNARRRWYASSPVRVGSVTMGLSGALKSRCSFSSALDH
jgi:hypothetical protein